MRREHEVAKIARPVNLVQQGCQLDERGGFEVVQASQIRDVNRIGPQCLAHHRVRVIVQHQRLVCASLQAGKLMEHEPMASQELVDIGKERLVLIELNKFNLRLDDEATLQRLTRMRENLCLASLGIDFQQIAPLGPGFGHIVESNSVDIRDCCYLHKFGQTIE